MRPKRKASLDAFFRLFSGVARVVTREMADVVWLAYVLPKFVPLQLMFYEKNSPLFQRGVRGD